VPGDLAAYLISFPAYLTGDAGGAGVGRGGVGDGSTPFYAKCVEEVAASHTPDHLIRRENKRAVRNQERDQEMRKTGRWKEEEKRGRVRRGEEEGKEGKKEGKGKRGRGEEEREG
jgi:hypothetical protein